MSTDAIVMMLVAMAVIWGGLALSIVLMLRHGAVEGRAQQPGGLRDTPPAQPPPA
jgi:hypothetical protein